MKEGVDEKGRDARREARGARRDTRDGQKGAPGDDGRAETPNKAQVARAQDAPSIDQVETNQMSNPSARSDSSRALSTSSSMDCSAVRSLEESAFILLIQLDCVVYLVWV